jgi:hypothetical protein
MTLLWHDSSSINSQPCLIRSCPKRRSESRALFGLIFRTNDFYRRHLPIPPCYSVATDGDAHHNKNPALCSIATAASKNNLDAVGEALHPGFKCLDAPILRPPQRVDGYILPWNVYEAENHELRLFEFRIR